MNVTPVNDARIARDFSLGEQPRSRERGHGDCLDRPGWLLPERVPFQDMPPLPTHPRLRFGRLHQPGRHSGADYHDVLNLGGNRFAVVMADLSGPGAFAAASMIRAVIRGQAGRHDDAGSLLHRISEHVNYLWNDALSAKALCAVVDTRRRTVRLACAGHAAPLLLREGAPVMPLLVHSTLSLRNVGLIVTSEYDLRSGDRLLFYTDGMIERENPSGLPYGVDRLRSALEQTRDFPASLAVACLAGDAERFAGGHAADDDQTLLMVGIG